MRDAAEPQQDLTELARQAFADNGYVPSDPLLKAAAKGLLRLTVASSQPGCAGADVSFDAMLQDCARD
jgi:hypothetical protein